MRYKKYIKDILKSKIFKSVYFNFKMLPFKMAIRMPVLFYADVIFRSLKGAVEIRGHIYPGMIKFGITEWYVTTSKPLVTITNNGKIIFNGPIRFLQGSYITVARTGILEFGSEGSVCGSDLKIMCFDRIILRNNVRVAWNVQMYDTSFHYILQGDMESASKLTKPIEIGANVWVGNSTTITKGSVIPDDCVVASNSLVNKDFATIEPFSLIAGVPAKQKGYGYRRLWNKKKEKEFDKMFGYDRTHL